MTYLILFVVSFFSHVSLASRDVPASYTDGLENKLPANYYKLFKIADKDSPAYTVASHELTMDLMHIAEQERKSGNIYMSFSFLKLANYIFPHRGDVSKKYQSVAEQVTLFLNASTTPCNDYYEIFLRDLKESFPAMMSQINHGKCEQISRAVRDIQQDILALEKRGSDQRLQKSAQIQKELMTYMGKESLDSKEEARIHELLLVAFLGNIEMKGRPVGFTENSDLIVSFEMIRLNSVLSYEGLKQTYTSITGKSFSENSDIFKRPIPFILRVIENDKIHSYPFTLTVKYPSQFNIWLNSFNFFAYGNYDSHQIYYQNDPYSVELKGPQISFKTYYDSRRLNTFEIKGLSAKVINNMKKIDIISNY